MTDDGAGRGGTGSRDGGTDADLAGAGPPVNTRAVGIDLGERRIGVSVSDSGRLLATPHCVLTRTGDPDVDRRAIAALVPQLRAGVVVVGLPLTLAGGRGPAASAAIAEAAALALELDVPVVLHDERLTTVEAERRRGQSRQTREFRQSGQARQARQARSSVASKERRVGIDAVAATVLLQAWLDQNRGKP